ncbi:hypothetical protein ACWCOW_40250 [Streptomyces sp. NPDC001939]
MRLRRPSPGGVHTPQSTLKNNFFSRPIPKEGNSAGGRIVADFCRLNCIVDGPNDDYMIKVS